MTKKAAMATVVSREETDLERLRHMETALHQRAASILEYAMRAPELTKEMIEAEEPPPEWTRVMGSREEALKAFRIAQAAWASQKEAPTFLKLAQNFLAGAMKARATEKQGPRVLNATLVQVSGPAPTYPKRLVPK